MHNVTQSSHLKQACPQCGCTAIHRSRRRGVIERHFFRVLRLSPYRCEGCDSRFFMREMRLHTTQDQLVTS
jgi:hypothetical protein